MTTPDASADAAAAAAAKATADAAAAAAAAAANKGTPWYGTPDTETLGYLQTRGLDKMTPDKAALAAIQSHREAEKFLGVPADQLVRLPKDASDTVGWNNIRAKLGAPADAKEYDYSTVKYADGSPLKPEEVESMRAIAAELHLPKNDAAMLAQKLVALSEKSREGSAALAAGALAQEQDKLNKNWGHNKAANTVVAENAMKAMGVTEEQIEATKGMIGYAATMEMFRNIGVRIGEDKFITTPGNTGQGAVMTRDAANYRLAQLQNDTVWFNKYLNGDALAVKEFNDLTSISAGR